MFQFSRLWRVGVTLCLLFWCACASQALLDEDTPEPVSLGEIVTATLTKTPRVEQATATPAGKTVPPLTLATKMLTPLPVIVKEDVEIMPTIHVPSGLQKLVDQAVHDLAERLDIGTEQIEVVEARAVVWADGSLNCPQPGMAYIQVQQEGVLIRLRVGKRVYNYHGGGGRAPFFCENPVGDVGSAPALGIEDQ
ncbi:MAG: hypothetical protein PVF45_07935 [Anaerolineae bacterium]|jgi:hypothetical protein